MDQTRFVFIHLPGQAQAVPAGKLDMSTSREGHFAGARFQYGNRYLQRQSALAIDPVSLPLADAKDRLLRPVNGLSMFGAIRDASPDAWGRRVIEKRLRAAGELPEWQYLDHAGSDRAGALDIRRERDSAAAPTHLPGPVELQYLLQAADAIEAGGEVPAGLMHYFEGGPSMGGMRPKAVIEKAGRQFIAKFPSRSDTRFKVPAVERATMELARRAGLSVPETDLVSMPDGRAVMLIERFDRVPIADGHQARHHMVSALTMLGLYEMDSPSASYSDIADAISNRASPARVDTDRAELFGRMVFNILVNNNDDHLRNHAFLWDGDGWVLSPLYDVVPSPTAARDRDLHLRVGPRGRLARLDNAYEGAGKFKLKNDVALSIIDRVHQVVRGWRGTFEDFGVSAADCDAVAPAFRHSRELGADKLPL